MVCLSLRCVRGLGREESCNAHEAFIEIYGSNKKEAVALISDTFDIFNLPAVHFRRFQEDLIRGSGDIYSPTRVNCLIKRAITFHFIDLKHYLAKHAPDCWDEHLRGILSSFADSSFAARSFSGNPALVFPYDSMAHQFMLEMTGLRMSRKGYLVQNGQEASAL